jgi:hypothetical protein
MDNVSVVGMLVSSVADKRISKKTIKKKKETRRKTAQEQNTNGKHDECDHVKKAAKQNP